MSKGLLKFSLLLFLYLPVLGICQSYLEKFNKITLEISSKSFVNFNDTKLQCNELIKIANHAQDKLRYQAEAYYWLSYFNNQQGIIDTVTISKINHLLELNRLTVNNVMENALLKHSLALSEFISGDYSQCITHSLTALEQYKKVNNKIFIARVSQLLGSAFFRTRNFGMAEKFFKASLSPTVPENEYYKSLINMYCSEIMQPLKKKQATKSLIALIPTIEKVNDFGLLGVIYLNLGGAYLIDNDQELAKQYFDNALRINEQINNKTFAVSLFINVSSLEISVGNYNKAEDYIYLAESFAKKIETKEQLCIIYFIMYNVNEKLNNTNKAFQYLKKYNVLRESIINNSSSIDSYEKYTSAFLESAQKEVIINKQKILLEERKLFIITSFSVLAILLGISVIYILYQKKKQQIMIRKAEKEAFIQKIKYEKTLHEIKQKQKNDIINTKIREVTSYSLMLSNKNNTLKEILHKTEKYPTTDIIHDNLKEIIKNSINSDTEGAKFMYHFNEVHPEFFDKLKKICGDLTDNNLRMCAYIKIAIPPKQIASLLNISPETVKNARYRLKKKLRMTDTEKLDDFIRSI